MEINNTPTANSIAKDMATYIGSDDPIYIQSIQDSLEKSINQLLEKDKDYSRFEDIEPSVFANQCTSPEHKPPMYIHIPQGKRYIHVCPLCGQRTVIQPMQITI